MKHLLRALVIIGVLTVAIMPVSAKATTPEQSTLPIPLGFCVRLTIDVGSWELVDSLIGGSIWLTPEYYVLLVDGDVDAGETLEFIIFVPTDTAFDMYSYGDGGGYLFFEGLGANYDTAGNAGVEIIDSQACSFEAYEDLAALAQTYMVPNKGFDVYQIFPVDGEDTGILSFTVTVDDIAGASAGEVLGSNDAGNIYFTYVGGGKCSVTYPYPDGKTNSQVFTCWN